MHMNIDAMSTDGSCVMDLSLRSAGKTHSPAVSQAVDSDDAPPSSLPRDGHDDEERGHNFAEVDSVPG